ncbi:MAG: hypothetical protein U0Y68_11605 [Blastocatellia bacterium]
MSRLLLAACTLFILTGCHKAAEQTTPAQPAAAQATPAVSPTASSSAMAVAHTLATPSGSPGAPPPNGKDAPKNVPNVIGDRLHRALTLEEINQLPPETRDAILRAQGRLPASPAPKKK